MHKPAPAAKATEGKTMANFDIPLTIGFFLIITGILTWTAFAVYGCYQVLTALERLLDRITRREEPEPVRIYPHQ
jgi:hypothetical protein